MPRLLLWMNWNNSSTEPMPNIANKHVFFLGIGGIGMSALARYLHALGHVVGGYDLAPSPLLKALAAEGMDVIHSDQPAHLPEWVQTHRDALTVVWTPAIPQSMPLYRHFLETDIVPIKRAEMLGRITDGKPTLAVAGTHGKTTTSSWLAAMMNASDLGCHAFLGGIDAASGTNYLSRANAIWHIVEADEYDRSFHHLHPTCAAITNLEADHLDVYGSLEAFQEAFEQFGSQVKDTLLLPHGLAWPTTDEGPEIERFALLEEGQNPPHGVAHMAVLSSQSSEVHFALGSGVQFSARPALPGRHNTANALVAAVLASKAGVGADVLQHAVAHFGGVKRRMDVHLDAPTGVYIDDYAHHPTELEALLHAVREQWPQRELTLVFQPHLYSRTRDFGEEFARVLGLADRVFLLPIYPAREKPIPGVDAQWLFDNISSPHKHLSTSDSIFGDLKACSVEVLITAGAGDIDRLVPQAIQHMQERLG